MIRDQKLLLPSHKDERLVEMIESQSRLGKSRAERSEGSETRPVLEIICLGSAPFARDKSVLVSNDLGVKVGRQLRPVFCQTTNVEVATQMRCFEIHIDDANRDIVRVVSGLLRAVEGCTWV